MHIRNNGRHRRLLFVISCSAVLAACGGAEDPATTTHTADAANASGESPQGIAGIYAAGGGDLSILQLGDTLPADIVALSNDSGERKQVAGAGNAVLPSDATTWSIITKPVGTPADALPMGVPAWWDWANRSVIHSGNYVPPGFQVLTGWGHVLNAQDAANLPQQSVEMRNHQTLTCSRVNGQTKWIISQTGAIQGAAFRADYSGNSNQPATTNYLPGGVLRVNYPRGQSFHFWPNVGRKPFPPGYCGMMVVVEARAVQANGQPLPAGTRPGLLLALGADYWLHRTVGWAGATTNRSVGVAQLRRVTSQWTWYGFKTASDSDLNLLRNNGAY